MANRRVLLYYMVWLTGISLGSIIYFPGAVSGQPPGNPHTFALGDSVFLLDGKPLQMISGEMHYTRIPREYWRDRIRKAKAMGLNTIGMYIFWNVHEPEPGRFDFSGNNDVAAFVRTAQEEGMWVVMRPSPYVCAEWEFGGYPWWLLKDSTIKVRSKDPAFLAAYRSYILRLGKELAPLQVTHGGNILMIQVENEYGSYSNDQSYLELNRRLFREAGLDVPLFTCDPVWALPNGVLPGTLPAVNGSSDPKEIKAIVNQYHGGKGPYYAAEFYPGWFDEWGKPHARSDAEADAQKLDRLLAAGISVNMYMFHGGTTPGFMNGANMNDQASYAPQVSSYDYDAPLDEAGNPTPKFNLFREVIRKYLPAGTKLPPVPERQSAIVLPDIHLTKHVSLFDLADPLADPSPSPAAGTMIKPVAAADPLSFEDLNQAYGFVLYRTVLPAAAPDPTAGTNATTATGPAAAAAVLRLNGMRDFATVYLNGKRIAVLDRRLNQDSVTLPPAPGATLDILVENNGRINFGKYLTDNRQGLTGQVTLGGKPLHQWKMYRFPFTAVANTHYTNRDFSQQPGLYAGTFTLDKTGDTYLDMRSFGKGFVFLNGHNLGKYWQIGPQQTIYVPGVWLKKGINDIVVFDELSDGHTHIPTLSHPILDEVDRFAPGAPWYDNHGDVINAHGGGVLYDRGVYYWFGEKRGSRTSGGVTVYSSKDLYHWTPEGMALATSDDTASDIAQGCVMERPKVIYNKNTGKYVMWVHLELKGKGYSAARVAVAVSDKVTGPYTYLKSFRPNGNMSRDMTLFVDDGGSAYQIYSSRENYDMRIVRLSDDYLSPTPADSLLFSDHREAPAVFRYKDKYYLITSACTGWAPNKANVYVSASLFGPWQKCGNPLRGPDADRTFGGQSTYIFPVAGRKDAFIFMADRWNPKDLKDSRYLWLPVQFQEGDISIPWLGQWDLGIFTN